MELSIEHKIAKSVYLLNKLLDFVRSNDYKEIVNHYEKKYPDLAISTCDNVIYFCYKFFAIDMCSTTEIKVDDCISFRKHADYWKRIPPKFVVMNNITDIIENPYFHFPR